MSYYKVNFIVKVPEGLNLGHVYHKLIKLDLLPISGFIFYLSVDSGVLKVLVNRVEITPDENGNTRIDAYADYMELKC
jgi:hypothetical protein